MARGEDSRHQFKRDATHSDIAAAELAAFANSGGGWLFFGVNDNGSIAGLDSPTVRLLGLYNTEGFIKINLSSIN